MITGELCALISPYLISEERRSISILWPSQIRNHDPEQMSCRIWRNVQMDCRIAQQFQGRGIKIDRVNSICVAKPWIYFNILSAMLAKWRHHELLFSLRWACIYLASTYIPCLTTSTTPPLSPYCRSHHLVCNTLLIHYFHVLNLEQHSLVHSSRQLFNSYSATHLFTQSKCNCNIILNVRNFQNINSSCLS